MAEQFSWVPIYREAASRLVEWENRQEELIGFLDGLHKQGLVITPLVDRDTSGARFQLTEIDPFTFFGVFNRGIREEQRLAILKALKEFLGLQSPLPSDFDGVPILSNMRSWFISYQSERQADDVPRLWRVFECALRDDPLADSDFVKAFDEALTVKSTSIVNLTIGLFWIRPDTLLNLDSANRKFLQITLPAEGQSSTFYVQTVRDVLAQHKPFPQVSLEAWLAAQSGDSSPEPVPAKAAYWFVGAHWSDEDPPDMTKRFLEEGIWQNGWEDKHLDLVRSMAVGERIAIKAATTKSENFPFHNRRKTESRMVIKAVGTITANRDDGRTVEVEWDTSFKPKDWFFYTYRGTVWRVRPDNPYAEQLIAFTFQNQKQDYDWYLKQAPWNGEEPGPQKKGLPPDADVPAPYGLANLASGAFMSEAELQQALVRLGSKKNLIIQGPPGVGKTFIARRLAYAFLEARDDERIQMIQFHQSYSYDDFIRGYRPVPEQAGTFGLQDGVFHRFCARASQDTEHDYVFIIDEINRGNLSQIFGELLMLIEGDKRGPDHAVPLVYSRSGERPFYIPSNLYLIGLMNVADRSLAIVDYALRRRFAFMTLRAQYGSALFREWLEQRKMHGDLITLIVQRLSALNEQIANDPLLGENYQVGHSFFCPKGDDFSELGRSWYEDIIETEVVPLLREYWFDDLKRAEAMRQQLIA